MPTHELKAERSFFPSCAPSNGTTNSKWWRGADMAESVRQLPRADTRKPLCPAPSATVASEAGGRWVRSAGGRVEWELPHCRVPPLTAMPRSCIPDREILIVGDSHMRNIFSVFVDTLCDEGEATELNGERGALKWLHNTHYNVCVE
eukprot:gene41542-49755_t